MNPRDRIVLQKIKQYCIDIEKLVERFGNIDLEIVWETIQTNIPELEQKCGEILAGK